VHLAGEADAGDFFAAEVRGRKRLANRDAGGAPPVFGVLLGPADLGRGEGLMLFGSRGDDATVVIDDDDASSSGTNVNPENADRTLLDDIMKELQRTSYRDVER
jgi:hypothetical protein